MSQASRPRTSRALISPGRQSSQLASPSICRLTGEVADCALLFRPDGVEVAYADRIAEFVERLDDVQTFSHSRHSPLCTEPFGVFFGTKVNTEKAQLVGRWLAAWFRRAAKFRRPPTPGSN
jgi:hypothetical protein